MAKIKTSRAMNEKGWIFADTLVALAILTLALSFIFPAVANLQRMQFRQEQNLHFTLGAESGDTASIEP